MQGGEGRQKGIPCHSDHTSSTSSQIPACPSILCCFSPSLQSLVGVWCGLSPISMTQFSCSLLQMPTMRLLQSQPILGTNYFRLSHKRPPLSFFDRCRYLTFQGTFSCCTFEIPTDCLQVSQWRSWKTSLVDNLD